MKGKDADGSSPSSFAAALAQALDEQQQPASSLSSGSLSEEEYMKIATEAYRQLCFDHPLVDQPDGLFALAIQLLHQQQQQQTQPTKLALSTPLVDGCRQLLSKEETQRRTTSAADSAPFKLDDEEEKDEKERLESSPSAPSLFRPTPSSNTDDLNVLVPSLLHATAALAWTIFGELPLRALQCGQLSELQTILGTFRGRTSPNPRGSDTNGLRQGALQQSGQHQSAQISTPLVDHEPKSDDNDDIESEVWAAESDPSDFDYGGSGFEFGEAQQLELQHWAQAQVDALNPTWLSHSSSTLTWNEVAQALTDLVQDQGRLVTSSTLVSLWSLPPQSTNSLQATTATRFASRRVTQSLTQLVLTLVLGATLPSSGQQNNANASSPTSALIARASQYSADHWFSLTWYPLHLFRDAVIATNLAPPRIGNSSNTNNHWNAVQEQVWNDYLQLLHTLVQYQHFLGGNNTNGQRNNTSDESTSLLFAPATWMGLNGLSGLCGSLLIKHEEQRQHLLSRVNRVLIPSIQKAILRLADDWTDLLEQTFTEATKALGTKKTKANGVAVNDASARLTRHAAVTWTFLSLFQVLATTSMTAADAQLVLNSGWWRQWLLLWKFWRGQEQSHHSGNSSTAGIDEDSVAAVETTARAMEERAIFGLVCASPTLLGKYAWRFPGFAAHVCRDNEDAKITQPSTRQTTWIIVWNLWGIRWGIRAAKLASSTSASTSSTVPQSSTPAPQLRAISRPSSKAANKAFRSIKPNSSSTSSSTGLVTKKASKPSTDTTASSASATLEPMAAPSIEQCRELAWSQFKSLCHETSSVLSRWNERSTTSPTTPEVPKRDQNVLDDFILLVQQLERYPLLLQILCNQINSDKEVVHEILQSVSVGLARWKSPPQVEIASREAQTSKAKIEDPTGLSAMEQIRIREDDFDEALTMQAASETHETAAAARLIHQWPKLQTEAVAKLRKSFKLLTSIMENVDSSQSAGSESCGPVHQSATRLSSKTD